MQCGNSAYFKFETSKEATVMASYEDMLYTWIDDDELFEELIAQRYLLVVREIDSELCSTLKKALLELDRRNNKAITFLIDSPGGVADPMLQLSDVIRILNSPVNGLVMGDAASGALILLQQCKKRMMLPNSRLLLHSFKSDFSIQHGEEHRDETRKIAKMQVDQSLDMFDQVARLFETRTGRPFSELQPFLVAGDRTSYYIPAQEAKELNLIDEVVSNFRLWPQTDEAE